MRCVECSADFEPFVTGHGFYCAACYKALGSNLFASNISINDDGTHAYTPKQIKNDPPSPQVSGYNPANFDYRYEIERHSAQAASRKPKNEQPNRDRIPDPKAFLHLLPPKEQEVYESITRLPVEAKSLLWSLIQRSNKDHVTIYYETSTHLDVLFQNGFVAKNDMYRSPTNEISLFILPGAPYLMKALRDGYHR